MPQPSLKPSKDMPQPSLKPPLKKYTEKYCAFQGFNLMRFDRHIQNVFLQLDLSFVLSLLVQM